MEAPVFVEILNMLNEACDKCLKVYNSEDFGVKLKEDKSPVTIADLAVHKHISSALKQLTPEIPLISEEAKFAYEDRKDFQKYWLLDPIDGTKEFIKKSGEFTINLGLVVDGIPEYGFVCIPTANTVYVGGPTVGSIKTKLGSCIKSSDDIVPKSEKLVVDKATPFSKEIVIACSKDHSSPQDDQFVSNLSKDFQVRRIALGSTLKQLYLAEGKVHFCPRAYAPYDWDLAAVHAVVLGAGGDVSTFDGKPLVYNTESQRLPSFMTICNVLFDWKNYL
jgi:3'(2'), 5'-bisphosphate nucleotidase